MSEKRPFARAILSMILTGGESHRKSQQGEKWLIRK
jgi:hypothetical protein